MSILALDGGSKFPVPRLINGFTQTDGSIWLDLVDQQKIADSSHKCLCEPPNGMVCLSRTFQVDKL